MKPEIVIKFGHLYALEHVAEITAQKMVADIAEKSNGRIAIESYPAMQLGGSRELMTGIMNNTLEMCVTSTFGTVEEKILMIEMPYLFKDFNHIRAFQKSQYATDLLAALDKQNVHAVGFWGVGFRNIGNSKREVKTPADLKGLTIRAFENKMLKSTLTAFGANVTVLPFAEVYVALQTGTIDGEENPYLNTYTQKFYEVAKYKTETRHMFNWDILALSKQFWDTLNSDDQKLITDVLNDGTDYYTDLVEQSDEKYKKALQEAGVQITEISDYTPWTDAVKAVYAEWEPKFGKENIDGIRALGWK
jgi:tripartite ATP-independent transporter DctP family solute receptor